MGYQQAGRWAEAAASYEEAAALGTQFRSEAERTQFLHTVHTNLGLALQNIDRAAEAVAAFDKALAAVPNNPDGHHNRALALYKTGQYGESVSAFSRALELNPRDAESYFSMGNAHDKLGAPQQAAAAFRTAFELDPTDASAAYNLANAYRSLGQTDDAVQMYTAALRFTPRDAIKHTNLAHTLDAAGRYEEATASFTTALTLAPTDAGTYTALGHAFKSSGQLEKAVAAYKGALALEPAAAGAYAGMGSALKQIDPKAAAEAYAAAAGQEATGQEADEASAVKAWLDASPPSPPLPSARASGAREWAQVKADARYPPAFEGRAKGCARMPMSEAIKMGSEALLKLGPTLLTNATSGWQLQKWSDANLTDQVGSSPMRMLVMPTDVHPTLEPAHAALVEPASSHVYFRDYLRLLDRLAATEEFAVYVAQMNLLKLPPLLKQVCLPTALPGAKLTMANLWVGGHSMKNGLHFDVFDNLLHQIAGSKRALIFPPEDTPHLYYASTGANIRRHAFRLTADEAAGAAAGFANETTHEAQRKNVAMINVFDASVGETHPTIRHATPYVCELAEGEALFLAKNWHHAVISTAEGSRNIAVNTWYDLRGQTTPLARISALEEMFQSEGCA